MILKVVRCSKSGPTLLKVMVASLIPNQNAIDSLG